MTDFERLSISPAIDLHDGEPRGEHGRSCSRHHRPPRPIPTLLAPASGRVYWERSRPRAAARIEAVVASGWVVVEDSRV